MATIQLTTNAQKITHCLAQLFSPKQKFNQRTRLSSLEETNDREIDDRKQTEHDLRIARELQQALLKALPDLVIRLHRDGTYIDIHAPRPEMLIAPASEMLIAPASEMLGRNIKDFLPKKATELHNKYITQVLETGQDAIYDYSLPLNGVILQFESRMVTSGSDEVLSIIRNITEQRHMEKRDSEFLRDMKALQEIFFTLSQIDDMEVLYASMVRLIKERLDIDRVAVFIIDPKTGVLKGTYGVGPDGNLRDEHIYREVITDQHWTHDVLNSPTRTYLRENVPLYEEGVQIATGCWHAGSALWNGQNAVGYLVTDNLINRKPPRSYQSEITAILGNTYGHLIHLKQTQLTLAESEEHHRILLSAIPDLVFRLDYEGNFLDYHSSNPADLVAPPEVFLGRNIAEVMPPHLSSLILGHVNELIEGKKEITFEYELEINHALNQFEARIFPSGHNEIMAVIRDVTERKKLQEQSFKLALETARTKLLTEFVQNASHELRTPLAIINSSVFLLSKSDDVEKRDKYAQKATNQITQLTHLLNMILDMTKLDSDVLLKKQRCNVNNLLAELQRITESEWGTKNIALTTQFATLLPAVIMDCGWMQDAFGHLLNNAIRFTPSGGSINLSTYSRENHIVIEIVDTGTGISKESLPNIFERFWREDKAHTTPGFGLGLSIAQKIVEKHQGHIEVESEEGRGSTFKVVLPTVEA